MTNKLKMIKGADGVGYVDMTTESILSGNGTCGEPCRKYRPSNTCDVATKVAPKECVKKECCDGL